MSRTSRGRRATLVDLCPDVDIVIDVGADHGHVAHTLNAIATERAPNRPGRPDVNWVIADGLRPFRHVDAAIIAGMGARTILGIVNAVPKPGVLVLHATDDPPLLRAGLVERGWRIDAERLAPEGPRLAQVIRCVPGSETSSALEVEVGPRLLESEDPLLRRHLLEVRGWWALIAQKTESAAPRRHLHASERVTFVDAQLALRGWSSA